MYPNRPFVPPTNQQPQLSQNELLRRKYLNWGKKLLIYPPIIWVGMNIVWLSTMISGSNDGSKVIIGYLTLAVHVLTPLCISGGIVVLIMRAQIPKDPQTPPQF